MTPMVDWCYRQIHGRWFALDVDGGNIDTQLTVMGKSQIKSNHDVNQMTTVRDSIVYVRNVHLAWLSKIRDGTITEINSLTQLQ